MKKKKVVALLLAAAMTTASFMPSTGFFNVTEAQAEDTVTFTEWSTGERSDLVTIGAITAQAITTTDPEIDKTKGVLTVEEEQTVTMASIVTGGNFVGNSTSRSAVAASLGGIGVATTATTASIISGSWRVTSDGAASVSSPVAITASAMVGHPGYGTVYFNVPDNVTPNSFGAFRLKVTAKIENVSISGAALKQDDDEGLSVTGASLKYKDGTKLDEDLVSGNGNDYAYTWYYSAEPTSAEAITSGSAFGNGWKLLEGYTGKSISAAAIQSKGAYGVQVSFGSGSAYTSVSIAYAKNEDTHPIEEKANAVSATAIKKILNGEGKNTGLTVTGSYVYIDADGKEKKPVDTPAGLTYTWYEIDATSASAFEAGTITAAALANRSFYKRGKKLTFDKDFTNAAFAVVVSDSSMSVRPSVVRAITGCSYTVAPSQSSVTYTHTPASIKADSIGYAQNVLSIDNIKYLADGAEVTTERAITNNVKCRWFVVDDDTYAKVVNGVVTGQGLLKTWDAMKSDDSVKTYPVVQIATTTANKSGSDSLSGKTELSLNVLYNRIPSKAEYTTRSFIEYDDGSMIYQGIDQEYVKTWRNKNIVAVLFDKDYTFDDLGLKKSDSSNLDIKSLLLYKTSVTYATNGNGGTEGRRSSSTTPASSTTNGTTGGSTGTNGTTGGSSTGTSTTGTGTGTTTPTGTTPTTNVVENADGSKTTTTTETKADGSTVETSKTEFKDGSTLEVTTEKKADGTVIETTVETAANGDKATTVYTTSPNGTKSKKVSIVKADGSSETTTITENADGSATIVNETKDASGSTSVAYSLAAGAAGVTVDKIDTTAKKVVIPAKIAIAGGAATLKGVTALKANTLSLEGKTIKVTKVGAAALKGNKTATNLVIGKNIKTIGKQAFMNATKVKTVNFKGNVNTIGKNSFKNINKKATIKIKATAKQFKALKKKIKNKGAAPAKVTYKRVK